MLGIPEGLKNLIFTEMKARKHFPNWGVGEHGNRRACIHRCDHMSWANSTCGSQTYCSPLLTCHIVTKLSCRY